MPDEWAKIIDFPDDQTTVAEKALPNIGRVAASETPPVDEPVQSSRVHAPVPMAGRDPPTVRPGFLGMRETTRKAQEKFDLERAMGSAPNLGTGQSFEEMGFHEPTPDKGRLARIKEGVPKFLREQAEDIESMPWYLRTPYAVGKAGGKAVQGIVEEGKNIYRTMKEGVQGDADPRNITKLASNLFGAGTTKAMGAAEELGEFELQAFSKSGQHLTFGRTLKGHVDIKTNFPDADFWIIRNGDPEQIGRPTREYSPEHIGVRNRNHNIDPDYLYYAFENAANQGLGRALGTGVTGRQHITVADIEGLDVSKLMTGKPEPWNAGAFGAIPSRPNRWTPEMMEKLNELGNRYGRDQAKVREEFKKAFPEFQGDKEQLQRISERRGPSRETDIGVVGGKRHKVTVLVDSLRGRPEFEALSDELYRLFTQHRNEIMPAAHKLADELASKDPRLFDSITRLTEGTSHRVIGELAEQIAARQLYEQWLGTSDFELGAFGGRGPGGRIEIEDVTAIAKRLGEDVKSVKVYESPKNKTTYAFLKGKDLAGKHHAIVRVPTDEASHPGRRRVPMDDAHPVLDTTDANRNVDMSIAANAGGGRYSDIRNLEAALRNIFTKGTRPNPPEMSPRVAGVPPLTQRRVDTTPDPNQMQFDWDSVLEFMQ